MSSKYEIIAASLTAEHEREVTELQELVQTLRQQLTQPRSSQQSGDAGTQECQSEHTVNAQGPEVVGRSSEYSVDTSVNGEHSMQFPTLSGPGSNGKPSRSRSRLSEIPVSARLNSRMTNRREGSVNRTLFPALSLTAHDLSQVAGDTASVNSILAIFCYQNGQRPILANWLEDSRFEFAVLSLIALNTLNMCVQLQYDGFDRAYALDVAGHSESAEDVWPGANKLFEGIERGFVVIFGIELILRLIAFRFKFFCTAFNWLDFAIVAFGILEWVAASAFDPKMMRLLRLTRIARTFKSFRFHRFLDALLFLGTSIKASFSVLFWSLLMLTVIQCISALVLCQLLATWFEGAPKTDASRDVFMYYGTFTRSMLTMFEILLGNWPIPCRVLNDNVGEEFGFLVLVYKCVCGWAVLNVVSAVFIQQTMKIMSQDTSLMLLERSRIEKNFKSQLERLFNLLDMSHDGFVTMEEMEVQLRSAEVRTLCVKMGISVHDVEDMFNLFDISREGMKITEFINAAHAVRAQANSLDVARLLMHSRHMGNLMGALEEQGETVLKRLTAVQYVLIELQNGNHGKISTSNNGLKNVAPLLPAPLDASQGLEDDAPLPPAPLDVPLLRPSQLPRPQGTPSSACQAMRSSTVSNKSN